MLLVSCMNWIRKLLSFEHSTDEPVLRCLRALGVTALPAGRRRAQAIVSKAKRCPRCRTLLSHLFDCVGSTLFLDDDPHALMGAFKATECDRFSEQVLAALIILRGRPRMLPQDA